MEKCWLTVENFGRSNDVLLHVVPEEGAILGAVAVVQLYRVAPGDQFSTEIDFALRIGEVRRGVQSHHPAWIQRDFSLSNYSIETSEFVVYLKCTSFKAISFNYKNLSFSIQLITLKEKVKYIFNLSFELRS